MLGERSKLRLIEAILWSKMVLLFTHRRPPEENVDIRVAL